MTYFHTYPLFHSRYLKDQLLASSENVRVKHETETGKTSIRLMHPSVDQSGPVRVRAEASSSMSIIIVNLYKIFLILQNVHGQAQAEAKLNVAKKGELPRFLTEMVDRQVNERDNVKFVAKVEGCPEPEVQWTLNGEPIAGE
jgi:hypothetical protein